MAFDPTQEAEIARLAGLPWDECRAGVEDAAERLGLSLDRVMAGVAERRAALARMRADGIGNGSGYGEVPPPEKRPLFRPLPPAPPFPVEALGPLRDAAEAIQMLTRAPLAMCAQSVIAAATLAGQAQRDVDLPGGGRKPLSEMFVSVADSGERKTSVDKVALAPVHRVEARWREEAEAARTRFQNEHDAWKAAREAVKRRNKGNQADLWAAFDEIGPEPKPLPHPMLLIDDLTPEGLQRHLAEGRPWCGVFTAEGGLVVGGHGFSEETRMRTAALLNKLWDGEAIRRGRGMTGSAFLPGKRCSAHLMLQPVVADALLGDAMLDGLGTLARTLVVAPESTIGGRLFRDPPAECGPVLEGYGRRIELLLARPPATRPGAPDVLDPPALWLAPEARRLWVSFHDEVERAIGPGGELHETKAFGAKMAEHAGRLAAVLALFADPDGMEVPGETMACGVALARHYAAELLRLKGAAAASPDLSLAARLLIWVQTQPEQRFHLAQVYQRGPNALRDAATARRILTVLEEHGWLRRLAPDTVLDGASRRDAWELVP
jgi:hypothetical protein